MTVLRVLSTLAVMGAMRDLTAMHERETGIRIDADFAPTAALLERLRGQEAADLAILTAQGIDTLTHEGIIQAGTRTDVALSFVGLAIRAGASRPDIASVAAFKATLLAARSVAYAKIGASGLFFAGLTERLGIAAEVDAKATIVPSGFTAERLVSGEADLAVQQISELMVVPGIEILGPLPAAIQTSALFSAGVIAGSAQQATASAFAAFLGSGQIAPVLRRAGLEPAGLEPAELG